MILHGDLDEVRVGRSPTVDLRRSPTVGVGAAYKDDVLIYLEYFRETVGDPF